MYDKWSKAPVRIKEEIRGTEGGKRSIVGEIDRVENHTDSRALSLMGRRRFVWG